MDPKFIEKKITVDGMEEIQDYMTLRLNNDHLKEVT